MKNEQESSKISFGSWMVALKLHRHPIRSRKGISGFQKRTAFQARFEEDQISKRNQGTKGNSFLNSEACSAKNKGSRFTVLVDEEGDIENIDTIKKGDNQGQKSMVIP